MNIEMDTEFQKLSLTLNKFHYVTNVSYKVKNSDVVELKVERKPNTPIDTLEDIQYEISKTERFFREKYNEDFEIEWVD